MRLSTKLILIAGALFLIIGASGGGSLYKQWSLKASVDALRDDRGHQLVHGLKQIDALYQKDIAEGTLSSEGLITARRDQVAALLKALSGDGEHLKVIHAGLPPYLERAARLAQLNADQEFDEIGEATAAFNDARAPLLKALSGLEAQIKQRERQRLDQIITDTDEIMYFTLSASGVSAAMILLVALLFFKRVSVPLERAAAQLSRAAETGDLTARLEIRGQDEIGALAASYNRFMAQMSDALRALSATGQQIEGASGALRGSATQLTGEGDGLMTQTVAISAQLVTLAGEASGVAQDTQALSTGLNAVDQALHEMDAQAQEAAAASARAAGQIREALARLTALADAEREISEAIMSIQAVAYQTQLLALNATIEAATAGAAGRGFAVVADEVKALSKAVTIAAERIVKRNEEMRGLTAEVTRAIEDVEGVTQRLDQSNRGVAASMNAQGARLDEVNAGTRRAAQALERVQGEVGGAAEAARGVSEMTFTVSTDIAEAAAGLSTAARQLRQLIEGFRI
ncbi:methyl-accepting chemotaxis protein [Myxococcota bacterium]|nr:methyl-accepting chemotaxis protein [Myxococcota bacterium]